LFHHFPGRTSFQEHHPDDLLDFVWMVHQKQNGVKPPRSKGNEGKQDHGWTANRSSSHLDRGAGVRLFRFPLDRNGRAIVARLSSGREGAGRGR
jgi:hypothetical protein